MKKGSTVLDIAERLGLQCRYAKLWNEKYKGIRVSRDYKVNDCDIIEIHER